MNIYSIPVLVGAVFSLITSCFIYFINRKSQSNISFSLFCFLLFVWLFGYAVAYSVQDMKLALLFCRIACTGAMFTAPTFYYFAVSFIQKKDEIKFVVLAYAAMFLMAPLMMTSNLFISGVHKYYWGYYSKAGDLHTAYLVIFFIIFLRGFYVLLMENRKNDSNPIKRMQIKYIFIAYSIALLGAIDYIPKYGVEFFPFGFIFEIPFIIIGTYALITRRILNINVIFIRTIIFFSIYLAFLAMPIAIGVLGRQFLSARLGINWWLFPAFLLAIMTALGSFVFTFLRGKAENKLLKIYYDHHKNLTVAIQSIVLIRDFNRLLNIIVRILTKILDIKYASIFLSDNANKQYSFSVTRGTRQNYESINFSNSLIKYLQGVQKPIILEELKRYYNDEHSIFIKEMIDTMNKLHADLLVPMFVADELIGFLVLGNKRSGEIYTTEDLSVLSNLANQSALAIENAQFLKEREDMQAKLRKTSTLAAMGELLGIVDHEFRNKLGLISGPVQGMVMGMYKNKPEAEKKAADTINDNMQLMQAMLKYLQEYRTKTQANMVSFQNLQDLIQRAFDHSKDKLVEWKISPHPVFIPSVMIKGSETLPDMFKHLVINSVYSMEADGGTITVKARELKLENMLEVTYEDEGEDISQKIKDKEQLGGGYFVDRGKLGGLNLVLAQKIISDHKGTFDIQSNSGHGTRFIIRLPIDFTKVA